MDIAKKRLLALVTRLPGSLSISSTFFYVLSLSPPNIFLFKLFTILTDPRRCGFSFLGTPYFHGWRRRRSWSWWLRWRIVFNLTLFFFWMIQPPLHYDLSKALSNTCVLREYWAQSILGIKTIHFLQNAEQYKGSHDSGYMDTLAWILVFQGHDCWNIMGNILSSLGQRDVETWYGGEGNLHDCWRTASACSDIVERAVQASCTSQKEENLCKYLAPEARHLSWEEPSVTDNRYQM